MVHKNRGISVVLAVFHGTSADERNLYSFVNTRIAVGGLQNGLYRPHILKLPYSEPTVLINSREIEPETPAPPLMPRKCSRVEIGRASNVIMGVLDPIQARATLGRYQLAWYFPSVLR